MQKFRRFLQGAFVVTGVLYATIILTYLAVRLVAADAFWRLAFIDTFAHWLILPVFLLLPMALVLRKRRIAFALLPIALTGIVWFAPYFMPKFPPKPTGQVIRVLTFNVWGNNHDLSRIEDWIRQSGADLVLLQEVSPTHAEGVLPGLMDLYPYQSSQEDNRRWGDNISLSRYPIVESQYFDLGVPNHPDPLRLVVDAPKGRLAVYNVHLDWPGGYTRQPEPIFQSLFENNFYFRSVLGYDESIRNLQIERLLAKLQTEPYPHIVGGDFNMSAASIMYNHVAAQLQDSFREAGWGLGTSWPDASVRGMAGWIPPLVRIDYIWHSDDLQSVSARVGSPVGSDHLPVLADLVFSS